MDPNLNIKYNVFINKPNTIWVNIILKMIVKFVQTKKNRTSKF